MASSRKAEHDGQPVYNGPFMKHLVPTSVAFTLYLSAAVALGPLSTDMYLPIFPMLAAVFHATAADVQLTLSIFTFSIGGCQLIYGPITDRFGRKPVIVIGLLIYIFASFACLYAVDINQLIFLRFLQAFGVCAAIVIPRAMVRDLYPREQAARQLSRMGTIMGLAPAIAPIIGGYLTAYFGWHAVFIFMGTVALLIAATTNFLVGESLTVRDMNALRPAHIVRNYWALLRHREFLGFSLAGGLCFSGLFSFISGSPLVLIEYFGVPPARFGYYFGMVVIGFMTGTLVGPALTARRGLLFSVQSGTLISAAAGITMAVLAYVGVDTIAAVVAPMVFYTLGMGIVLPQSQAGSMAPFPEKTGSASALMGFLMLGFAAIIGYFVAFFYDGTQIAMVSAIAMMGILSALSFWLMRAREPRSAG